MFKIALFLRQKEEKGLSTTLVPSASPTHSMNVLLDIKRRIKLHNPIDLRDIESSSCHISAKKNSLLELSKLVESSGSLLLFLLAVDVHDTDVHVVE